MRVEHHRFSSMWSDTRSEWNNHEPTYGYSDKWGAILVTIILLSSSVSYSYSRCGEFRFRFLPASNQRTMTVFGECIV